MKFKYRIILKVRYSEVHFEFDTCEAAGEFAKNVLMHQVDCDDTSKYTAITMKIINSEIEEEE